MAIVAAMEVEPLPTASIESWTPQVIHSNHPSVVYLVKITNASGELNDKIKEINSLNVVTAGQVSIRSHQLATLLTFIEGNYC